MLVLQHAQCIRRPFIIVEPTTNNNHTNKPEAPEFEARVQAAECSRPQGRAVTRALSGGFLPLWLPCVLRCASYAAFPIRRAVPTPHRATGRTASVRTRREAGLP